MSEQSDIRDILGEIANAPICSDSKLVRLLKRFSKIGLPLKTCADKQHLGREIDTLKRYARRHDLKFPDYVPRHLKPKKEKKKRARSE